MLLISKIGFFNQLRCGLLIDEYVLIIYFNWTVTFFKLIWGLLLAMNVRRHILLREFGHIYNVWHRIVIVVDVWIPAIIIFHLDADRVVWWRSSCDKVTMNCRWHNVLLIWFLCDLLFIILILTFIFHIHILALFLHLYFEL